MRVAAGPAGRGDHAAGLAGEGAAAHPRRAVPRQPEPLVRHARVRPRGKQGNGKA